MTAIGPVWRSRPHMDSRVRGNDDHRAGVA